LEFSLGSSYFGGIYWCNWEGVFMDWGNTFENWGNGKDVIMDGLGKLSYWGNRQVGSLDTEAKTVSNVVDSLDKTVGVGVAVRSSYSTIGVSGFLLSGVEVSITVSEVSEFILRLELAGLGKGRGSNYSGCGYWDWGNSNWGGSNYFGTFSSFDSWKESSSIWIGTITTIRECTIWVTSIAKSGNTGIGGDNLCTGGGQYAQDNKCLHCDFCVG
jgi:hypothetical protein